MRDGESKHSCLVSDFFSLLLGLLTVQLLQIDFIMLRYVPESLVFPELLSQRGVRFCQRPFLHLRHNHVDHLSACYLLNYIY